MIATKWIFALCLAGGGGYQYVKHHRQAASPSAVQNASASGFVDVPTPQGENPKTVLVVAAENCPRAEAQNADRLASALQASGIPVARKHDVSFQVSSPDDGARLTSVMNGRLPAVFVNGRAKSDPTLEEVLAEYRNAR